MLAYATWMVASRLLRALPLPVAYGIANIIGTGTYLLWPRGRRALHQNYAVVLAEESRRRQRSVARQSLVNYCKYMVDFARVGRGPRTHMSDLVDGDGEYAKLASVLDSGRGAIAATMHLGNWDLGAMRAAELGMPITAIAESLGDRRLDAEVLGTRESQGVSIALLGKGMTKAARALRRKELVALVVDRPVPGDDGVSIVFFGRETRVPGGAARLAIMSSAKVVPCAFVRKRPGSPEVRTWADFSLDTPSEGGDQAIQRLTQAIFSAHEKVIRQYPEQWYMFREMWSRDLRR